MSDVAYREKAIEEYGEECKRCGCGDGIVVHHRNGDRADNRLTNLIPLCKTCHRKVHGRNEEFEELVRELGYRPKSGEHTCIQVNERVADALFDRKERGDNYADVIWRLIEEADSNTEDNAGNG